MHSIDNTATTRRKEWLTWLATEGIAFAHHTERIEAKLNDEVKQEGILCLLDHLRLCGDIPESYPHDSSAEKCYAKYTDVLLSTCFTAMGCHSMVINQRGDAADVEATNGHTAWVADAKAFRLSRTAKNQKDFKVQSMASWKLGKPFALLVAPLYHLPANSSQVYLQAITHHVAVLSYTHMAVLINVAHQQGTAQANFLLNKVFETVSTLHPSKEAGSYWLAINQLFALQSDDVLAMWLTEKQYLQAGLAYNKHCALTYLAQERERILNLSHTEALQALLKATKLHSKELAIAQVSLSKLMLVGEGQ